MKPERVQKPEESSATHETETAEETPNPADNSAADSRPDAAEKKPGATQDMKPERVQKP